MANALGEFLGGVASAIKDKAGIPQEVKMKPVEFADKISEIEVGKDVSGVTATAADVLTGKKIVDASGKEVAGTMQNNGAYQHDIYKDDLFMIAEGQYSAVAEIPKGYHDGNGKMTVTFQRRTIIPTKETQTINNSFHYPFIVNPIPDEYQDVSSVTATADDVRAGKVFVDAEGNEVEGALTGTIADVSEVTASAEDVLEGKIIVDSAGKKVYGAYVPSSGGGTLPAGYYWETLDFPRPTRNYQKWIVLNNELYCISNMTTGNGTPAIIYKYANGAWTTVVSSTSLAMGNAPRICYVEYNGKLHICGSETLRHYIFDGATLTRKNDLPNRAAYNPMFEQDGILKFYSYYDGIVYAWNESSDTWAAESTIGSKYAYKSFVNVDGVIYTSDNKKYIDGALTDTGFTNSRSFGYDCLAVIGKKVYVLSSGGNNKSDRICIYDFENDVPYTKAAFLPNSYSSGSAIFEYEGALCAITALNTGESSYFMPIKLHELTE